jgi:hypothetical protein
VLYNPEDSVKSPKLEHDEEVHEAHEVMADIDEVVRTMEVKFVDALREMMFGTKGSRFAPRGSVAVGGSLLRAPSFKSGLRRSQSAIANVDSNNARKPLPSLGEDNFGAQAVNELGEDDDDDEDEMDSGKFALLGDLASARQVLNEANRLAKALLVDIRFSLELKTSELDIPEGPTAMQDLDSCITYDKFTVIVKCSAALPLHSVNADKKSGKSMWAAISAAETSRVKGITKSHYLFEGDVDDLRDVVGALREARQTTANGIAALARDQSMKISELENWLSPEATPEERSVVFAALCKAGDLPVPPSDTRGPLMGYSALSKVMEALNITMDDNELRESGTSSGTSDDWVQTALTKYDTTGQGKTLDEAGFDKLLGFHARQLVGSSVESLVSTAQRGVFSAFLDGIPFEELKPGDERGRLREAEPTQDGFLHSSRSFNMAPGSSVVGGGGGGGGNTLRFEADNRRLQEALLGVLDAVEGAGLGSGGGAALKKLKEMTTNGIPPSGCADLISILKAEIKK